MRGGMSSGFTMGFAVAALTVLGTGCTSDPDPSPTASAQTQAPSSPASGSAEPAPSAWPTVFPSPSVTLDPDLSAEQKQAVDSAIEAYLGYTAALDEARRHPDQETPALAKYAQGKALSNAEYFASTYADDALRLVGGTRVVWVAVDEMDTRLSKPDIVLVSCHDLSQGDVVGAVTGRSIRGADDPTAWRNYAWVGHFAGGVGVDGWMVFKVTNEGVPSCEEVATP